MIEWFSGLVDGEGCFFFHIHIRCDKRAVVILPKFSIAMSDGDWVKVVKTILIQNNIPFTIRTHLYLQELSINGVESVQKLCKLLYPYSVVKKPIIERMMNHRKRKQGNRFKPVDPKDIERLANDVDFVRAFNRKRNVPYKWDGKTIKQWYIDNLNLTFY
jgi:hypothetical protein